MISNAFVLVAGWKENYVLAEQQQSISFAARRFRLQNKAGVLSPSWAMGLNVSDDVCMVYKANGAALFL